MVSCISLLIKDVEFFLTSFLFFGLLSPIWQSDKQYLIAFLSLFF